MDHSYEIKKKKENIPKEAVTFLLLVKHVKLIVLNKLNRLTGIIENK